MLSPRATYSLALSGATAWCCGFLAAPLTLYALGDGNLWSEIPYAFFHPVCHQMESRSLHIFGEPLAVCTRCSAIYMAFLFGTMLYPFVCRLETPALPSRIILLAATLPMVIDAVGGVLGMHVVTGQTRLVTGALFGIALPFFILPIVIEGLAESVHHPPEKGLNHA